MTTKTKHSPGPFKVETQNGPGGTRHRHIVDDIGRPIARTYPTATGDPLDEANATLLAASSNLADALEGMLNPKKGSRTAIHDARAALATAGRE